MSNSCCGVLKIVSKNEKVFERLEKILNYEDDEFCLYRCKFAKMMGKPFKDGDYWVCDFDVEGAWSCSPFFENGDCVERKLLIGYEKTDDGHTNFDKPIEGTAHFTDLCHLAKVLDFGCELFASEGGCGFCEHFTVDHTGCCYGEDGTYRLVYPEDEDGEPIYDEEPKEEFGIDCFMEFSHSDEIYGD